MLKHQFSKKLKKIFPVTLNKAVDDEGGAK